MGVIALVNHYQKQSLIAQINAKDHKIWITLLEIALEKVFSEQEKILNN